LKDLEEIKEIGNVFVEDIEEQEYYPEWMSEHEKYHIVFE
jgi:hypothetical protein